MAFAVSAMIGADLNPRMFRIARIESDLVKPMPNIQLLTEHQVIEYGPVRFPKKDVQLWLPKSADLYFDFRKHRYYRRHSFDHFMLFSTDTDEKVAGPKGVPNTQAPSSPETR